MNVVITIGREFGSGGRELGRRLADDLGIAYYDKEIILEIEHETPFSKEYIEEVSESRPVPLFPIHYGNTWTPIADPHFEQSIDVYRAQSDIIKNMADKSSCVIIGRGADFILRDRPVIRLFVYADMDQKIARCKAREKDGENLSDKEIAKRIKKVDVRRKKYYEFYTGQAWGDRKNYDMMINTTNADIKEIANMLAGFIRERMKEEKPSPVK